jgi:hypothetical protein
LAGHEVLEGNGVIGFSTPLATFRIFNGWDAQVQAGYANPVSGRVHMGQMVRTLWANFTDRQE